MPIAAAAAAFQGTNEPRAFFLGGTGAAASGAGEGGAGEAEGRRELPPASDGGPETSAAGDGEREWLALRFSGASDDDEATPSIVARRLAREREGSTEGRGVERQAALKHRARVLTLRDALLSYG
jgi:hypothetical protein